MWQRHNHMYEYAIKHNLSSVSPDLYFETQQLRMNVFIGYAIILPFHNIHLRDQTNVAYAYKYV